MRYLSIFSAVERDTGPTPDEVEEMGKLIEEFSAAGSPLVTEGCLPSSRGVRIRRSGKDVSVTDGPFTESKEIVGGFALLRADSKEEAIELAKRFLEVAGDGECEVRELYETPALALE
jgi:hypothetical protein